MRAGEGREEIMQDFQGNVAVITGAASGFGREFARLAGELGMRLVLADVEHDPLEAVVSELRANGSDVIAERADVSRAADVERLAQRTVDQYGGGAPRSNNSGVGARGGVASEGAATHRGCSRL